MKTLKSLMVMLLLAAGTSAMAQSETTSQSDYIFKKHFFLDLQGGAQYTVGETKLTDLLSPNVQIGLGYQFCPMFGMRLQANGWQSKGAIATFADGTKTYKWNYVAPGLDFMFNLSNLFCGFNPKRFFNVTAFIGGGLNIAWANDECNDIASGRNGNAKFVLAGGSRENLHHLWDGTKLEPFGRGGIDLNFRVSDAVSIMLEGNVNVLNDQYNSKHADNPDIYANALLGVRINLGKTYTKPEPVVIPEPVPEPAPAPAPVVEEKAEPVVEKVEPIRRDVFFKINVTDIADSEKQKVADIAEYLKKHADAKVNVTGYADAGTGTKAINARLAAKRADTVAKSLINDYGISQDRISYTSKGDTEQPFAENDLNRVSICIAE